MRNRRSQGRAGLGLAMAFVVAALAAAPAAAAPPSTPLPQCADTVTPDSLTAGQNAIGYSVTQGTTPTSFNVKILGVMPSGIAPGRDLIIVRTSGPAMNQAGGIWFGMSGSPVYTMDGKLIGAISYGFSSTSKMAGITPANPDMLQLLLPSGGGSGGSAASDPRRVRLSHGVREQVARESGMRASQVGSSMSQLEVPLSISGLVPAHRERLRKAAIKHHMPFFIPSVGGSSASGKGLAGGTLRPGESFAAALSYGDITMAGIGTTTYVCNGRALAFGHPFFFTGPNQLGASGATTFGIVQDPVFGPFKMASVTEPVGVVDQDRLPGLRARLDKGPPLVPVVQHTKSLDTGLERTGQTDIVSGSNVNRSESLPQIAWIHSFSNIDSVFDQVSGGSSRISWTIQGDIKHSGKSWKLTRKNQWVSNRDISFGSTFELADTLQTLTTQKLAPVALRAVHINVDVQQAVKELRIRGVKWSADGRHYEKTRSLRVRPGGRVYAKVKLRNSDTEKVRTEKLKMRVPEHPDRTLLASVGGGESGGGDFLCAFVGICRHSAHAKSFEALLKELKNAPQNNDLVGSVGSLRHASSQVTKHESRVVSGREFVVLKTKGRHRHRHGVSIQVGSSP
jgi:SpoIVB peptidase S55